MSEVVLDFVLEHEEQHLETPRQEVFLSRKLKVDVLLAIPASACSRVF